MRLLIVDDDAQIRQGLEETIDWHSIGFDGVYSAFNGIEALKYLEENYYDVVITDVKMPGKDGIELAKWINENSRNTCVVVISGYSEFEYARKAIKYGVKNYMMKPVNIEELIQQMEEIKEEINLRKKGEINQRRVSENYNKMVEEYIISDVIRSKSREVDLFDDLNPKSSIVSQLVDFIEENYPNNISISDLAVVVGRTPNYVSKIFKEITGKNCTDYINDFRIMKARNLLKETDDTIFSISMAVGYSNSRYFVRKFKDIVELTPTEYRSLFRKLR